MFKTNILVTYVIVNWNVAGHIKKCIDSILCSDGAVNIQIIVVDNNSTDNSKAVLNFYGDALEVIWNQQNQGFAKACNQGISIAIGEFIFFVNPDTVMPQSGIKNFLGFIQNNEDIGVLGPKLVYPNGLLQKACARRSATLTHIFLCRIFQLDRLPLFGQLLDRLLAHPYKYDTIQNVEAVSGASMLIPRKVLDQAGGFSEDFLHTGEDMELCCRIRNSGYSVVYNPELTVIHLHGASSKQKSAKIRIAVNLHISGARYFDKCKSKFSGNIYRASIISLYIPISVLISIIKTVLLKNSVDDLRDSVSIAKHLLFWKAVGS
jgi:GT2 family glycosyltransferase